MRQVDTDISKDSRKEQAYDYLYNAIIKHQMRPGTSIIEQEVSNVLGISRTPIRESLNRLESEGLVRHIKGRGTFVTEVTLQDVEEILELREIMEIRALHNAWSRISDKELEEQEQILMRLDVNSSEDQFYDSDRKLHELIVLYSGNQRLVIFLKTINTQIERLRQIALYSPGREEESRKEHLAIIRCLKQRNYHEAENQLRNHIQNVKINTIEVFRKYSPL
jgi:DNA-binding GntR family transcriptional regulator